jgi:hypothetical protein
VPLEPVLTESTRNLRIVNRTRVEWDSLTPLRWTAFSKVAENKAEYEDRFDLSGLTHAFEEGFLTALRDSFIGLYRNNKRRTVKETVGAIRRILERCQARQLVEATRLVELTKISCIDSGLLTAIRAHLVDSPEWIPSEYLRRLKSCFKVVGNGTVFVDVSSGEFPVSRSGRPLEELMRSRVVAQALSRSAQIAVFKNIEDGFQNLELDLSIYVFWNLAHHLFIRPESYRQITCGDLAMITNKATGKTSYFLKTLPAKRRDLVVDPIVEQLDEHLGRLLQLQIASVAEKAGPLYGINASTPDESRREIERKLALFPRRIGERKPFEVKNFGMLESGHELSNSYVRPLQKRLENIKIGFNVMRHTIASHLAAAGCSASTIQAVLKHATENTARVYVDLATKELKDRLSASLQGLSTLFPAYSAFTTEAKAKQIPIRAISSNAIDPETGALAELTPGQCGGQKACEYAPLACYGCWRFIPAIDADHSVNLRLVVASSEKHRKMGRAFAHLIERDEVLKLNIEFVIAACSRERQANADCGLISTPDSSAA